MYSTAVEQVIKRKEVRKMIESSLERGWTSKGGVKRELTAEEREIVFGHRREFIATAKNFLIDNNARLRRFEEEFLKEKERPEKLTYQEWIDDKFSYFSPDSHNHKTYIQIVFDNHQDSMEFLHWIWDKYGGAKGVEFTRAPLNKGWQIVPWLLRIARVEYPKPLRVPTIEGFEKQALRIVSPYPWDPASIEANPIV